MNKYKTLTKFIDLNSSHEQLLNIVFVKKYIEDFYSTLPVNVDLARRPSTIFLGTAS